MSIFGDENKSTFSKALDIFGVFANPAIVRKYKASPGIQFLINLYDETGESRVLPRTYVKEKSIYMNGKQYNLTPEQQQRYQELMGTKTESEINRLVKNQNFINSKPETQVKWIYNILNKLGEQTRYELWKEIR